MIVEDHTVTRLGIKFYLQNEPGFEVVAEASNGLEAVAHAKALSPNVILMDVMMPEMDGVEASRQIKESGCTSKIIMLTSHGSDKEVLAALSAGAAGYCLKDISHDRLVMAIRSVNSGDLWLDSAVASAVLGAISVHDEQERAAAAESEFAEPQPELSDREMDVLNLIVEGCTNQEIAKKLYISNDTVKTHIRHIMDKLAVNDRTQAAVKAVRRGLL